MGNLDLCDAAHKFALDTSNKTVQKDKLRSILTAALKLGAH